MAARLSPKAASAQPPADVCCRRPAKTTGSALDCSGVLPWVQASVEGTCSTSQYRPGSSAM